MIESKEASISKMNTLRKDKGIESDIVYEEIGDDSSKKSKKQSKDGSSQNSLFRPTTNIPKVISLT